MTEAPGAASGWSVRPASPADIASVSRTLASAFSDDAVWTWFIPDDATRERRLERMFSTFASRVYLRQGNDCYTTDAYEGAALWAPPGHGHMSTGDVLRILPGWTRAIGPRDLLRAKRGVDSLDN